LTSIQPPLPLGAITLEYDNAGRVMSRVDGNHHRTDYAYDDLDRLTSIRYEGGGTVSFSYDASGNRLSRTDAAGGTAYEYDSFHRVVREIWRDHEVSYTYDNAGRLLSMTDASGTTKYIYESGRLKSVTEPGAEPIEYEYYANGRKAKVAYPNGVEVTWAYEGAGFLTGIKAVKGSEVLQELAYTYERDGKKAALVRSVIDSKAGTRTDYDYDGVNRLIEATVSDGHGNVAEYTYEYDGSGNLILERTPRGEVQRTYNAAGQMLNSGAGVCEYDLNGNKLADEGNGWTAEYNNANQMVGVTLSDGTAVEYRYADPGQLRQVREGEATLFHNRFGVAARVDERGAVYYTRGPSGELIGQRTAAAHYYYLFDRIGSIRGVMDEQGLLVNSYDYEPFGVKTEASVERVPNVWGFAGGYQTEVGLIKFGERFYDPRTGRMTQTDPLLDLSSALHINRYAYALDNPVNYTDPTGEVVGIDDIALVIVGGLVVTVVGGVVVGWFEHYFYPAPPPVIIQTCNNCSF
jgi:RHS repeat-associated protein